MYADAEVGGFLRAVGQSHCCYHITLSRDAQTGASSLRALVLYLLPKMIFGVLDVVGLRVVLYLVHDKVNLLQLQVDNVVHDALCLGHVLLEEIKVEACLRCERIAYVRVEVH